MLKPCFVFSRVFGVLLWCLLITANSARQARSQAALPPPAPPYDSLSAIVNNIGVGTLNDVRNIVGNPPRASALTYVSNNQETRRFWGILYGLTPQDRFAILSDDGSRVRIEGSDGSIVTPIARYGGNQSVEGPGALANSFTPLVFEPRAGVDYTFTVDYANTIHSSPADLDGITLFRYRLPAPLPVNYTPQLQSNQLQPTSARLFWQPLPAGYTFQKYRLFASATGTFAATAAPIFETTNASQTQYLLTGLTPRTRYYYKLVVLYSVGSPATNQTSSPALHNFKTPGDTYQVEFDGDTRISAGGNVAGAPNLSEAHIATLTATIKKKNEAGAWVIAPATVFRLQLSNSGGSEGAQLSATQADDTASPYSADPVEVTTDEAGKIFFAVLSSRQTGSATISVQENTGTVAAPQWEIVSDKTVEFAKPESRRLFGVIEFNQTAAEDRGWQFDPPVFETPNGASGTPQIIRCRLFLRFRKTANALSDPNYFDYNGAPIPSLAPLDTNGNGVLEATELVGVTVRGSETAPLVNTPDGSKQVWLPVNGHKLRIKIKSVGTTGDDMMVPSVPKSPRVVMFSNATGKYAVVGANDAVTYQATRPNDILEYLPLTTQSLPSPAGPIEGAVEFWVVQGALTHRVNQITFSVEDITIQ